MLLVPLTRVSTGEQVTGTGLQRQSDAFAEYAQKRGWDLHPETYSDEGVSGFSGANLEGDLGRFLADLKAQRFGDQSVALGVEDLDRLSRQFSLSVLPVLVDDLLNAGVTISVISKGRDISRQSVRLNPMELHELLFWMGGAHEFSDKLSKRITAHRASLRAAIREGKPTNPGAAPCWIELHKGEWVLGPFAETMKRILAMAQDGMGSVSIAKQLNSDGVPTPAAKKGKRANAWASESVMQLIKSPAVHGAKRVAVPGYNARLREWKDEVAHKRRQGVPQEQWPVRPVREFESDQEGYFPALLSKAEHALLLKQIALRKSAKGAAAAKRCTWIGQRLTRCICGAGMTASSSVVKGVKYTYLRCNGAKDGSTGCTRKMVPLQLMQTHLLTRLRRDDLASVVERSSSGAKEIGAAKKRAEVASALVEKLTRQLQAGEAALVDLDDPTTIAVIAKRQGQLEKDLAAATVEELDAERALQAAQATPTDQLCAEVNERVRDLQRVFAEGKDTAEDRYAINQLLARLRATVSIDKDRGNGAVRVGLAFADGETRWEMVDPTLDYAGLVAGMTEAETVQFEIDEATKHEIERLPGEQLKDLGEMLRKVIGSKAEGSALLRVGERTQ